MTTRTVCIEKSVGWPAALRARHEELLAAIPEQELREFVRRHYPHWGVKEREEGSGG